MDPLLEEPDPTLTEEFTVRLQQIAPFMGPVINKLRGLNKGINELLPFRLRWRFVGQETPHLLWSGGNTC